MSNDIIEPYVVYNCEGGAEDHGWYAVDAFGATAGPYSNKEEAEKKISTLSYINMDGSVTLSDLDQGCV